MTILHFNIIKFFLFTIIFELCFKVFSILSIKPNLLYLYVCVCVFLGVGRGCKHTHTLNTSNIFMLLYKIFTLTHNLDIVFFIYNIRSVFKLFVNNIFIKFLLLTITCELYFKVFYILSIKPNSFLLIKLILWAPGVGLSHLGHTHFDNNLAIGLNGDE